MKVLDLNKLTEMNPTRLGGMTNAIGQKVEFFEHPILGEEASIIAVFDNEIAFSTGFYDLVDMTPRAIEIRGEFIRLDDYEPFVVDGQLKFGFEM
jgi:hypothetical protein